MPVNLRRLTNPPLHPEVTDARPMALSFDATAGFSKREWNMITSNCPHCGGSMRVKVARRGPNSGSEFWGCNAYRTKGCRGTCQVPRQDWDWFGFIPVPVSIIRNAQNSHRKDMAEYLEYDYGSGYGVFDQTRESVAYAITKNFAGSSSRRLISLAPGYSDIEGGLILLDDGSQLQFNKGTSAIAMFDIDNALRSAILRAKAS